MEFPTHIVVSGKRYLLNEDAAVTEHNEKCMHGELSMLDYILPVGKRLRDVETSDLLEAEKIARVHAEVALACVKILKAVGEGDKGGALDKIFELYRRFELWPPLEAGGLQ